MTSFSRFSARNSNANRFPRAVATAGSRVRVVPESGFAATAGTKFSPRRKVFFSSFFFWLLTFVWLVVVCGLTERACLCLCECVCASFLDWKQNIFNSGTGTQKKQQQLWRRGRTPNCVVQENIVQASCHNNRENLPPKLCAAS